MKIKSDYAEGGFLDDGAAMDDVSGNEVPTGSLQEEVRDDIPAQLSEGEFVLPADVVRFIGLEKLMKIRDTAKAGLSAMEEEGQIGGQPAPHAMMEGEMDEGMEMDALIDGLDGDDFESASQNFAEGGSVLPTYKKYTGREYGNAGTVEYRKYTNAAGDIIDVAFVQGKPVQPIPTGYYPVGAEGTEGTRGAGVGTGAVTTVNSGPSMAVEIDKNYKNSQGYKNKVIKSNRLMGARSSILNTLHKDNMTPEEVDGFYAALTPMAQAEYESRFRNPVGLDKFFAGEKSPVEMMIIAQDTVNSRNLKNGVLEKGSYTAPNGEPITLEGMREAFAKTIEGTSLLNLLGKEGFLAKVTDMYEAKSKERVGNNTQPTEIQAPKQVFNQAHWQNRISELGKLDLSSADIQAQLRAEQRNVTLNSSRMVDAYGNKIQNPGQWTVWDQIAEVQLNSANAIQVNMDRANGVETDPEKLRKPVEATTVADEEELTTSITSVEETSSGTLVDPTSNRDGISSGTRADTTPTTETPFAQDAPPTDPKLRGEMGLDEVRNEAISPTTVYGEQGDMVPSTPTELGISVEDTLWGNLEDDAALTRKELARARPALPNYNAQYKDQMEQQIKEGAEFFENEEALALTAAMGELGTTGSTADESKPDWIGNITEAENAQIDNEQQIRSTAKKLGLNEDKAVEQWKDEHGTVTIAEIAQQQREQRDNDYSTRALQANKDKKAAAAYADKVASDRSTYLANQAALAKSQQKKTITPTPTQGSPHERNRDPAPKTTPRTDYRTQSVGERGRGGASNAPTGGTSSSSSGNGTSRYFKAAGGLISKKKPAVKKMRSDNTAGLASKKKSKERAQAKKGALAAKRT